MSYDEHIPTRAAACLGKVPHGSEAAARKSIKAMLRRLKGERRKGSRKGGPMPVPYRCPHCASWHIGRRST